MGTSPRKHSSSEGDETHITLRNVSTYRVISLRGEYLPSRIPSRLGWIKRERHRLRRKVVEEEGQQRCLMEDACNGNKDEGSIGLCVTLLNELVG